ncbi:hypothetical protein QUF61_17900 [Candidatus Venteria ishoeyi]|uniref:hypothetical protein n=1 Tax=Candidatus Venteria ishoeyi TaxID=1899563 RepID=UPI0025A581BE|nr:hypothetical protein [Candidatus Venteria ishoeyi]MDM8548368.1 hypothetical protein [Candidatus Venteria ishoeyi]
MNNCASCENNGMNVMSFTWFTDQEPAPNFKKIGELAKDNSSVWSCGKCGTTYYQRRGTVNDTMVSLNPAHCDSLLKWGNKTLHLAPTHKKTLKEIGGIFQGFVVGIDALTYPCRCKIKGKGWLDFCIVSFQPFAPAGFEFENAEAIYLADEVEEIEHSSFSLSREARHALEAAVERDRDFFPTILTAPDKVKFLLLNMQHFFQQGNYKAPELKVIEQWQEGGQYIKHIPDRRTITWIIMNPN